MHPDDAAGDALEAAEAPRKGAPRALLLVLLVCLVALCWVGVSAIDAAAAHGLFGPVAGGCGGG